jgi:hypothetical protein
MAATLRGSAAESQTYVRLVKHVHTTSCRAMNAVYGVRISIARTWYRNVIPMRT